MNKEKRKIIVQNAKFIYKDTIELINKLDYLVKDGDKILITRLFTSGEILGYSKEKILSDVKNYREK